MIYARNGQDKLSNFGSTATALKCKVYLCLTVQELGRREAGSLEFSMLLYTCMFFFRLFEQQGTRVNH